MRTKLWTVYSRSSACRDEIAMAITYQVAKEHETLKEGRATKRRRKDGLYDKTKAQAWRTLRWWEQCSREYSGTTCWRRSTESRVYSLRAICFTVSPIVGLPVFCFVGLCVLLCGAVFVVFDWWLVLPFFSIWCTGSQGRHSSQDCHHRHDERSTGAKKKSNAYFHQVHSTGRAYSSQSARAGEGGLFLGRLDQGLYSRQRREHACRPSEGEGTACSKGWQVLQYLKNTYIGITSGRLQCGWCCFVFRFWLCCFTWNYISSVFATFSPNCSWQKGDRPDNGDVEPCSNQPKTKNGWSTYLLQAAPACYWVVGLTPRGVWLVPSCSVP